MKIAIFTLIITCLVVTTGCVLNSSQNQEDELANNLENEQIDSMTDEKTIEPMTVDPTTFEKLTEKYSSAVIKTSLGDVTVKFYNEDSPNTVNNFMNLANLGFYNGTVFHRVIKDFMIQGGDPNSKDSDWTTHGIGGPGYKFNDEINNNPLVKGSFAMANSGLNTNGSQFFIVTAESTPWLDGKHTNFGYVLDGMDIVEKMQLIQVNQNDHPIEDLKIISIELK
jgi:cyclophilin family peptidyl-prolyl cis-trans isomerase